MINRKPCALLMNDMHISKNSIVEFQKNWDEALEICIQRQIPEIIIGGDLWLSRSSQSLDVLLTVQQAILKANSINISLTIAEGNHDLVDQESLAGYSHIFEAHNNVHVIGDYMIKNYGYDVSLFIMSYFPETGSFTKRYTEMLNQHYDPERYNLLYIHQGINGAIKTANDKELPSSLFEDFNAVLVGHYHDRCVIHDTNIEYIGASRQHNFGEDEEKGYTILFDDGTYEFVKNQVNTRYCVVHTNFNDICPQFYSELKHIDDLYKIKVCVNCTSKDAGLVDKSKLLEIDGVVKVEIITEDTQITSEDIGVDFRFDKEGVQHEYQLFCEQKGINHKTGLNYLKRV